MADGHYSQRNDFGGDVNTLGGVGFYGSHIRSDTVNINQTSSAEPNDKAKILRQFGPVDPQVEKNRILGSKDRLLSGSCDWVVEEDAFKAWWGDAPDASILWIHGEPGKGKTMILASVIDHISRCIQDHPSADQPILAYFFCQRTDSRLNRPEYVIKGLLYSLLTCGHPKVRLLYDYLRDNYVDHSDATDMNQDRLRRYWKFWTTLENVLAIPTLPRLYLLIDALDEVEVDDEMKDLLKCLTRHQGKSKVRWLITSRNEPYIKEILEYGKEGVHTSLELNSHHVAKAVTRFIEVKVAELRRRKRYDDALAETVHFHLQDNSQNTFLWVALVCKELQAVRTKDTMQALHAFPPGLTPFYRHMLERIMTQQTEEDMETCLRILRMMTIDFGPKTLEGIACFCEMPWRGQQDAQQAEDLVTQCGSFISIGDTGLVQFIHQSCSDFFTFGEGKEPLFGPLGPEEWNVRESNRCFLILNQKLTEEMFQPPAQGVDRRDSDWIRLQFPSDVLYASRFWTQHVLKVYVSGPQSFRKLAMSQELHNLLHARRHYWMKAMKLTENMVPMDYKIKFLSFTLYNHDEEIDFAMKKCFVALKRLLFANMSKNINKVLTNSCDLEDWQPSSPGKPSWIVSSLTEDCYDASELQRYEDCKHDLCVAANGKFLVSSSQWTCPRIWSLPNGRPAGELIACHAKKYSDITISPQSTHIAVITHGVEAVRQIEVWSISNNLEATWQWSHEVKFYVGDPEITFSPDGSLLALKAVNSKSTISVLRIGDGRCVATLRYPDHVDPFHFFLLPSFSADEERLMAYSNRVHGWRCTTTVIQINSQNVRCNIETIRAPSSLDCSSNLIAVAYREGKVAVFDIATGKLDTVFTPLSGYYYDCRHILVAFQPGGDLLAITDRTTQLVIWNSTTREIVERRALWDFHKGPLWLPDGTLNRPHSMTKKTEAADCDRAQSPAEELASDLASRVPLFSISKSKFITAAGEKVSHLPSLINCYVVSGDTIAIGDDIYGLVFIWIDRDAFFKATAESDGRPGYVERSLMRNVSAAIQNESQSDLSQEEYDWDSDEPEAGDSDRSSISMEL